MPSSVPRTKRRPWMSGAPGARLRSLGLLPAVLVAALMWAAAPARADTTIAAAADIACDPTDLQFNGGLGTFNCRQKATSDLLVGQGLTAVLPIGDLQYECGGFKAWDGDPGSQDGNPSAIPPVPPTIPPTAASYGPSWGRLKSITYPVPGNHEYKTTADNTLGAPWTDCDPPPSPGPASGFFRYFASGSPASSKSTFARGYYSFNLSGAPNWQIIALNSNCAKEPCKLNSRQETFLKAELAHPTRSRPCTLAYFHHSLYSSKTPRAEGRPFWNALYDAGAEVVLGGHVHSYERFAPQNATGGADPLTGIRQFVVGTGGRNLEAFTKVAANSEVRGRAYGVLKLTLRANTYDWQFVPVGTPPSNAAFTDSGTGTCHGKPDRTPPTVVLTAPANGATVLSVTPLSATAVDPPGGVGLNRVEFLVDGKIVGTATAAPYSVSWDSATVPGGLHTVSARAVDGAGNQATTSVTVTVLPSRPTPPGAPRASSDIFRVRVDGAGLRRLTRAPVNVDYDNPAWSRNGRRIAFSGPPCAGCPGTIFLVQPGGGAPRRLPGAVPGAARPDWGRLDRTLTFVGGPTNAVFTISSIGTGRRRLTPGRVAHDQSVFSPDGRQIAFTTQQPNGRFDIFVMRANGAGKRNLTRTLGATELQPAWSHDGRRIAFTRRIGARWAIFVMPATGGRVRRITSPALNCQQPAWSPNDRQIACARFTPTGSNILLLRANGAVLRRLSTGTATAWAPTWSPDGRRIAFVSVG